MTEYKYNYCVQNGMAMEVKDIVFPISEDTRVIYDCEGTVKLDSNIVNGIAVGYTMTATLKIYINPTMGWVNDGQSSTNINLFGHIMLGTDDLFKSFWLQSVKGDVIYFRNDSIYKNTVKSVSYSGNSIDSYIDIVITKQLHSVVNIFQ